MENPLYFYKIKIPFNDSNFQTIYFTEKTISIKHQLKYYKFKNLILLQDYFNPFLIPELKKEAILQSSLNDLIFFPNLKEMSIEEILEIKKFIEFKPFIHNFYYIKAKLSEIDGNFKEALEFYKKGKDNNDYFCIINLIRIYCENELSIKYQVIKIKIYDFTFFRLNKIFQHQLT